MALFELLAGSPATFMLLLGVLGLLVGSFVNVVVHRLPVMMEREWHRDCVALLHPDDAAPAAERFNLAVPRSRCPGCGGQIAALDNIPVLSWLLLRGRCRHCGTRIAARYPVVEIVAGAMGAVVAWRFGFGAPALLAACLSWSLLALALLLWLGLLANLFDTFTPLDTAVIGAIAGYLVLWAVY